MGQPLLERKGAEAVEVVGVGIEVKHRPKHRCDEMARSVIGVLEACRVNCLPGPRHVFGRIDRVQLYPGVLELKHRCRTGLLRTLPNLNADKDERRDDAQDADELDDASLVH